LEIILINSRTKPKQDDASKDPSINVSHGRENPDQNGLTF
jgi:hypothetical protein